MGPSLNEAKNVTPDRRDFHLKHRHIIQTAMRDTV